MIDHLDPGEDRAPAATSPASTSSPTCASASASARGSARVAEDLSRRTVALPFFTALEEEDQKRVVASLAAAIAAQE